jgi:hypothetical protein
LLRAGIAQITEAVHLVTIVVEIAEDSCVRHVSLVHINNYPAQLPGACSNSVPRTATSHLSSQIAHST